jgi:hypothetical protein
MAYSRVDFTFAFNTMRSTYLQLLYRRALLLVELSMVMELECCAPPAEIILCCGHLLPALHVEEM